MSLSSFFLFRDGAPTLMLIGSHEPWLVLLSLLTAVFGAAMALQLAGMAREADSPAGRQLSLLTGAVALGAGIWSMHFIGMLAFQLCTTVGYSLGLTLLSMLPSLLASWVALSLLARGRIRPWQLLLGGLLVGSGIGAMHYMGMAAMRMSVQLRYDPLWFAASIVVAVLLAMLALWTRFGLIGRLPGRWALGLASLLMGAAIAGMHYTAMAAARFVGPPDDLCATGMDGDGHQALLIALVTLLVGGAAAGTNGLLRYRHLNQQLRLGESRLRAMVDTAVDGIITIDGRGIIQSFNAAAERLFGWSAAEVLGRNVSLLMPEPHRAGHDGYLAHHLRTGEARIIGVGREVTGVRKDGSPLPMRLALGRVALPGEALFVGFVSDISARRQMETALRDSEQQHRSLIANIPGVTFRCRLDADWSMLFISDAVQTLLGWAPADFVSGQVHIGQMIHPDDRERVHQAVHAALAEDQSYVIEYRLQTRDGQWRWVSESGRGVRDEDGALQWIDGVIVDISESKRRHAEHQGFSEAINHALAVLELDLEQRIVWANTPFLALSGYSLEELQGRPHALLIPRAELASEQPQRDWERLLAGQFLACETLRLGKDGRQLWVHAIYNPILDANGRVAKITLLAQDLSQRRAMELALRDAKERAEQAAAAKSAFLANMSHEIRTPMNAILGFSELLLDTPLNEGQRHQLGTVRASARSLLALLNNILDTAKLEQGAVQLECADFSLRAVCRQTLDSLFPGAHSKGLALSLDYPEALPQYFRGDALRLQQVLLNLLGNAIKFTPQGSVLLSVRQAQSQVHLCVQDTGIGIAPDRLERIFDPFAQADASTTRRFGGTGLGTTISRQLVERMGGRITVDSTPGQGSRFHVWLPLPPGAPVLMRDEPAALRLPPLRLLVADDVAQNGELLEQLLGRDGHRLTLVQNGLQAVQALADQAFDAVLMDVHMPELDGLEATRRIRARELADKRARIPIVALSASVLPEDREAALAAGMDGFATKPVEPVRLNAELARVLGLSAALAEEETLPPPSPADGSPGEIDWARGLRLWGSADALGRALRRFAAEQAGAAAQLRALLAERQWGPARELAHRWRGVAGSLALPGLLASAQQLEEALRVDDAAEPQLAALAELGEALGLSLEQVLAAIAALQLPAAPLVAAAVTDAADAARNAALAPALAQLEQALRHGELAEPALRRLQQALPAAQCEPLQQALDQFDFDQALQALAVLRAALAPGDVDDKKPLP